MRKMESALYAFDPELAKITSTIIDRDALEEFSTFYPEVDISPWQQEDWRNNGACGAYALVLKNVLQHWDKIWKKENAPGGLLPGGLMTLTPQAVMWLKLSDMLVKCIQEKMEETKRKNVAPPGTHPSRLGGAWKEGLGRSWPKSGRGICQYEMILWTLPCKNKLMKDRYGITDRGELQGFGADAAAAALIRDAQQIGWPMANTTKKWPPTCKCPPIKPLTLLIASPPKDAQGRPLKNHERSAHAVTITPDKCIKPGKTVSVDAWEHPAQIPPGAMGPPSPTGLIGPPTFRLTIDKNGTIIRSGNHPRLTAAGAASNHLRGWTVEYIVC